MLIVTGPEHGRQIARTCAGAPDRAARRTWCSFVPAETAAGPLDRIFTRIGAADDLAGSRSTFIVEIDRGRRRPQRRHRQEPHPHGRDRVVAPAPSTACRWPRPSPATSVARSTAPSRCSRLTASSSPASRRTSRRHAPTCASTPPNIATASCFLHAVKDGPASRSYGLAVAQLAGARSDCGRARVPFLRWRKAARKPMPPRTIRAREAARRPRTHPRPYYPSSHPRRRHRIRACSSSKPRCAR